MDDPLHWAKILIATGRYPKVAKRLKLDDVSTWSYHKIITYKAPPGVYCPDTLPKCEGCGVVLALNRPRFCSDRCGRNYHAAGYRKRIKRIKK